MIVIVFIIVIVLIFVRTAYTQSVEEIINKYIAARGGLDQLNSIQSISFTGTREIYGHEIPIKITKVQGKLFRTDFEFEGSAGYTIITPSRGWEYSSGHYVPQPIPAATIRLMQNELDIGGALVNYYQKGYKATFLGKEMIDDKPCYKIRLTSMEGKDSFYFIETKNFLLLQTIEKVEPTGKTYRNITEKITSFSDYRNCNGVLFPHTIQTEGIGINTELVIFDKIEVNLPVDEKMYQPGI